jgi:hypothetical protein
MSFPRLLTIFIFGLPMLVSCGNGNSRDADSIIADSPVKIATDTAAPVITVTTYMVQDSADKQKGWGYELYVNGKRTIRQPIIPAVPGNDAFATENDAKKIGELAAYKMRATGSFPTISIHDLDSLGIKHQ